MKLISIGAFCLPSPFAQAISFNQSASKTARRKAGKYWNGSSRKNFTPIYFFNDLPKALLDQLLCWGAPKRTPRPLTPQGSQELPNTAHKSAHATSLTRATLQTHFFRGQRLRIGTLEFRFAPILACIHLPIASTTRR